MKDIIRRMAILWQQKKLVDTLEKLEVESIAYYDGLIKTEESMRDLANLHLLSEGQFWILENNLVKKMLLNEGLDLNDRKNSLKVKRLITASVACGFIQSRKNSSFVPTDTSDDPKKTSPRELTLDPDKAPELQNMVYFWGKYLPEALQQPTQFLIQLFFVVLTAIGAVLGTLSVIMPPTEPVQVQKERPIMIYLNNEQQEQIPTTAE